MNFYDFKKNLDAIVVSKDLTVIDKSDARDLNVFMAYRWLSMEKSLLKEVANIQQINSKLTPQQEYKLLLFNTSKLDRFNPTYIKK